MGGVKRTALVAVALAGIGASWFWMRGPRVAVIPIPDDAPRTNTGDRSEQLARVRLSCDVHDLDRFVEEQQARVARTNAPSDVRVLAQAYYERALVRDIKRGLAVGAFISKESYAANRSDIEAGLAAIARARKLGDDSAELDRIEAGLLTRQFTGLAKVFRYRARVQAAIQAAAKKAPRSGHVHIALGCDRLFTPAWLGQDIEGAIQHFRFAAKALPLNERPLLFTAFAHYLKGRREKCIAWLERARERSPKNPFVRAVLARLRRGEKNAFERDVE